jgi:hypothetical protein
MADLVTVFVTDENGNNITSTVGHTDTPGVTGAFDETAEHAIIETTEQTGVTGIAETVGTTGITGRDITGATGVTGFAQTAEAVGARGITGITGANTIPGFYVNTFELHPNSPTAPSANALIIIDKPLYKSMAQVRNAVTNDETGNDNPISLSTSLDILAVYIKGQSLLYTEAKVYCEQQLNMLMLPAIFISALCTLLSLALQSQVSGPYIVASFAAINSFILALISYLKLDAKAEAHKTSAYQYDKIRTICEFNSGKIMFFIKNESFEAIEKRISTVVDEIQKKVEEIKDTNKFVLPQHIRYNFNTLYTQNLFSDVKALQLHELMLLTDLKRIENDIIDAESRIKLIEYEKVRYDHEELQKNIQYRWDRRGQRDVLRKRIIAHRKKYLNLETVFQHEIQKFITLTNHPGQNCGCLCSWLKT